MRYLSENEPVVNAYIRNKVRHNILHPQLQKHFNEIHVDNIHRSLTLRLCKNYTFIYLFIFIYLPRVNPNS